MKTPSSFRHLSHLDGLRALAAMFVVLHHAFLEINSSSFPPAGAGKYFLDIFLFGHYAVDFFIVLSGFCLMLPAIKEKGHIRGGVLNFFRKRAWRILPPYYLAMGLSLLLIRFFVGNKTGTHWDVSLPVTGKSILTHLFLVQDVFREDTTINHAFWSIAVEWRIYFLFPLLLLAWRYLGAIGTTGLTVIFSYFVFHFCSKFIGASLSAQYLGLFAMGMLGAAISFPPPDGTDRLKRLPWGRITLISGLIMVVLSQAKIWHGGITPIYLTDYVVGWWSTSLIIAVSGNTHPKISGALRWKPLVFTGTFAYSIYLIHAPLLQVLWQYLLVPFQNRPLLMFAALSFIGMPLILILSYLFFLVCERPFLRRKEKIKVTESLSTKAMFKFDTIS